MMKWGKHEALSCPDEFQGHLTAIFGVNQFGDPNFRIIWGQTETMDVADSFGRGYVKRFIGHGQPCWIIQRWRPAEIVGEPDAYYRLMCDPETGLALAGEYPEFGSYETVTPLMSRQYNERTKELEIKPFPLDWEIIERAIPVLMQAEALTEEEKQAALEAAEAKENAQLVQYIADRLYDSLPAFYGPTSHAARMNKTALIDRKMAEIEQIWKRLGAAKHKPARGFYQER